MFTHQHFDKLYDFSSIDVSGNRYYQVSNDLFLPSVTTVINYGEKPWLVNWRQSLGKSKADKELKRCSERGVAVHLMCEQYIKNVDVTTITNKQPREYTKLFNQIRFALQNRVNNVKLQEHVLWSEVLGIAGRCDLIAEYDGVLSVIDFKSATNVKDSDKIENYFLQCTAYALMVYEIYNVVIEDIVVIIGSERGLMPQVFKRKIFDYVAPLNTLIETFYKAEAKTIARINKL